MQVVIQKVQSANCVVDNLEISKINQGFMILVGFTKGDNLAVISKMCKKIANLRIFEDEQGKMNLSIKDIKGEILLISQFTLYANPYEGNRPSFTDCLNGELALPLYEAMLKCLNDEFSIPTLGGAFGKHMVLNPVCDGPVTIQMEFKA